MYYYIQLPVETEYEQIRSTIEEYRIFLFRIHFFYEISEIKTLPTRDEIRQMKKENLELYKKYLNLARKYYETTED